MEGTHEEGQAADDRQKAANRLAERVVAALSIGCTEIEVRKPSGQEGAPEDPTLYPDVADRLASQGLGIEVRRLRHPR